MLTTAELLYKIEDRFGCDAVRGNAINFHYLREEELPPFSPHGEWVALARLFAFSISDRNGNYLRVQRVLDDDLWHVLREVSEDSEIGAILRYEAELARDYSGDPYFVDEADFNVDEDTPTDGEELPSFQPMRARSVHFAGSRCKRWMRAPVK